MTSTLDDLAKSISTGLCKEFDYKIRKEKIYLKTPFYYDDGDGFHIVIKKIGENNFVVTDEGNSIMRLSYDLTFRQINSGTRKDVLDSLIDHYEFDNRMGEILKNTEKKNLVSTISKLIQLNQRITDLEFLSQKTVTNTFIEDFKSNIRKEFEDHARFGWYDKQRDEDKEYTVDVFIEGEKNNIGIYPMYTSHQVMTNTISILQLKEWGHSFLFYGVFQKVDDLTQTSVKKFSRAANKSYDLDKRSIGELFQDIKLDLTG